MKPAPKVEILLPVLVAFLAAGALAQTPALWHGMAKGKYQIGFKFERQFDHARPFQNKYDQNGNLVKNRARPMQMFVWYPAAHGANSKYLRYEE